MKSESLTLLLGMLVSTGIILFFIYAVHSLNAV